MRTVLELFKQTFKEWSEDKAPRLAAALAYYTAFSLAPILVIALWVVNFFIADTSAGRELLLDQVGGLPDNLLASWWSRCWKLPRSWVAALSPWPSALWP